MRRIWHFVYRQKRLSLMAPARFLCSKSYKQKFKKQIQNSKTSVNTTHTHTHKHLAIAVMIDRRKKNVSLLHYYRINENIQHACSRSQHSMNGRYLNASRLRLNSHR